MYEFIKVLLICAMSLTCAAVAIKFQIWRYFWFPLAAFCIIVVIEWAYDWEFVRPYDNEISSTKYEWKDARDDTKAALKDETARLAVEAVEFLRGIAVVWVFLVSLYIVLNSWNGASGSQVGCLIIVCLFTILIYGIFWEHIIPGVANPWVNQLFGRLNGQVYAHSGRSDFGKDIWLPVVKATHFALILAAFATGLIMTKPGESKAILQSQSKYLKHLLFSCATLCVIHVIGMGAWNLREAALLADAAEGELVLRMSAMIAAGNAINYICILVAFHLPAAEVLTHQSIKLVPKSIRDGTKKKEWLKSNKLSGSTAQFYAEIFAMLSPLVAGLPLFKLLALAFSA